MTPRHNVLLELGRQLRRAAYSFVAVTPETHRRVNARAERSPPSGPLSLRDIFGWNRRFPPEALAEPMLAQLRAADAVEVCGVLLRSRVRFATLGSQLFAHSSFPTEAADAVFFGPDTYRFCALLRRWAPPAQRAIDLGCGSGAGGISLAERVEHCLFADINPRALELCEVNCELAGVRAECVQSDLLRDVAGEFDLILANPPYMRDDRQRVYRDGGGAHGEALSVRIVEQALTRLRTGGTLIVYTGSAIVGGEDCFERAVMPLLRGRSLRVDYEELDPDVFGEELERPGYEGVERIAAVGLRVCVS